MCCTKVSQCLTSQGCWFNFGASGPYILRLDLFTEYLNITLTVLPYDYPFPLPQAMINVTLFVIRNFTRT